jgi:glycosyltransferase involved in cell wall biosynthesis
MADLVYKKWITCTPVSFRGEERVFFSRDSGLCCRALQSLGAEARVVMPEPVWDDEPDVQRAPYRSLHDSAFWKEQQVEAVILYAWADPRYACIAKAIRKAGIRLFLNMDTGGLFSAFVEPRSCVSAVMQKEWAECGRVAGTAMGVLRLAWQVLGLHRHYLRLCHMDAAHAIGVVTPIATERVKKYVRRLGRSDLIDRIHFLPHPINPVMEFKQSDRERAVIAVGRWDDLVKRPALLVSTGRQLLQRDGAVRIIIVGRNATLCRAQMVEGSPGWRERVEAFERLEHDALCERINRVQILLCTSRSESFFAAGAEALLCGSSVVGPQSPLLTPLEYFVGEGRSGRLATASSPDLLAEAVLLELDAWNRGERDAAAIAKYWRERLVAEAVVQQVDDLLVAASSK